MNRKFAFSISIFVILSMPVLFPRSLSAGSFAFVRSQIDNTAGDCKAAGDINGDGYPDLVIGGLPGENLNWYRYPSWQKTVIAVPAFEFTTDCSMGDVDGDGDLDIVVADGRGANNLQWFENPRPGGDPTSGAAWTKHFIGSADGLVKDIKLSDFDKNGRLDVAVRTDNDMVYIFFQNDADSWNRVQIATFEHGEGLGVGDIDQDGDMDLIGPGYWLENPDSPQTTAWPRHSISDLGYTDIKVAVADFDKDGHNDIVFSCSECANSAPIVWYGTSNPKGGPWTAHPIANLSHAHTLQAYDMDRDGDIDIVTGQLSQSSGHEVIIYLNGGNGLSWAKMLLDTPPNGIHNGVVVDIGNDGDYDIYAADYAGNPPVWLWENQLDPYQPDLNDDGAVNVSDLGILLSNWGATSKPPADINQDGKIDEDDLDILLRYWNNP